MPSNYRPLTGKSKRHQGELVESAGKVLFIFSTCFFAFAILCSFAPPSSKSLRSPSWPHLSSQCDPFSQPGFVDSHGAWRTFDPSCSSAGLLSQLIPEQPTDPSKVAPHPIASQVPELAFLSNRTVLLIGDHQVDRTLVEHFCKLSGRDAVAVDRTHSWGEALTHGDAPLGHYCHVPEYDFVLLAVYSFGVDTSEFWRSEHMYNAPGRFEERVKDLWEPMLVRMTSSAHTSPALPAPRARADPDLIVFNSGLWDLARYAMEDVQTGAVLLDNLSEERILAWRSRMVDMLSHLHTTWPRTPRIAWRNTHIPLASEASTVEWFLGNQGDAPKKNHPLYHANRIAQLNNAQASALHPHGDDVAKGLLNRAARIPKNVVAAPWAEIMLGQDQHQLDPLNPNLQPGGTLFAEMLLWHLREAVSSR